jgi:hypothetical protein
MRSLRKHLGNRSLVDCVFFGGAAGVIVGLLGATLLLAFWVWFMTGLSFEEKKEDGRFRDKYESRRESGIRSVCSPIRDGESVHPDGVGRSKRGRVR